MGVITFLVLLCIYLTVLIALSRILPMLCLAGLAAWMVLRRPCVHPDRARNDVKRFSQAVGEGIERLLRTLFRPLID